jgi:transcriptional/translational regulatory protein YebC/TACO1
MSKKLHNKVSPKQAALNNRKSRTIDKSSMNIIKVMKAGGNNPETNEALQFAIERGRADGIT